MYFTKTILSRLISVLSLFLIMALQIPAQHAGKSTTVYISSRKSNALLTYRLEKQNGKLVMLDSIPLGGEPAPMAVNPGNNLLYVGQRSANKISTFRIDRETNKLTLLQTIPAVDNPVYLSTDHTGRFLLTAYYNAGKAAVYAINSDGTVRDSALQIISGFVNPHSILADPSNKFVFIADKGGDKIYQYTLDSATGKLTANVPPVVITPKGTEPRHFVFSGKKGIVYFVNETNNTVTAYHQDADKGTLKPFQQLSTLPKDYNRPNKTADIHLTPDGRFLYASNRGHNSIVVYSVNPNTGKLYFIRCYKTVGNPRAFAISPEGDYLVAASENSSDVMMYSINRRTGALKVQQKLTTGEAPSWVIIL